MELSLGRCNFFYCEEIIKALDLLKTYTNYFNKVKIQNYKYEYEEEEKLQQISDITKVVNKLSEFTVKELELELNFFNLKQPKKFKHFKATVEDKILDDARKEVLKNVIDKFPDSKITFISWEKNLEKILNFSNIKLFKDFQEFLKKYNNENYQFIIVDDLDKPAVLINHNEIKKI